MSKVNYENLYYSIQVIGSLTLCFLTGALVYFTAQMVKEMKKTRRANIRPNVVVTLVPSIWAINFADILIKNIGLGGAYDISIKCKQEQKIENNKSINDLSYTSISFLAPNEEFRSSIGSWKELGENELTFEIVCKNLLGETILSNNSFNHLQFTDLSELGGNIEVKIYRQLEKMAKDINKIASQISKR